MPVKSAVVHSAARESRWETAAAGLKSLREITLRIKKQELKICGHVSGPG